MIWVEVLKQWKLIAIGLLAVALWFQGSLLSTAQHDLEQSRAVASAMAASQAARTEVINAAQQENLKTIEARHDEKHVEAVRAGAVATLRRGVRKPAAGGSGMPGIAARVEADDGTREECAAAFAVDADAAEDADTLSMWQEWARLNNIPVQP